MLIQFAFCSFPTFPSAEAQNQMNPTVQILRQFSTLGSAQTEHAVTIFYFSKFTSILKYFLHEHFCQLSFLFQFNSRCTLCLGSTQMDTRQCRPVAAPGSPFLRMQTKSTSTRERHLYHLWSAPSPETSPHGETLVKAGSSSSRRGSRRFFSSSK